MPKAIFTAALTGGIHTPTMSPYLPITPDQLAEHAIAAYEAGFQQRKFTRQDK